MTIFWLGTGIMLGLLNTFSQWWIIQRLDPEQDPSRSALRVVSSSILRLILSGAALLLAVQQNILSGLILLAGLLSARWTVLYYMNKKTNVRYME